MLPCREPHSRQLVIDLFYKFANFENFHLEEI
jgi:hypothetical protein